MWQKKLFVLIFCVALFLPARPTMADSISERFSFWGGCALLVATVVYGSYLRFGPQEPHPLQGVLTQHQEERQEGELLVEPASLNRLEEGEATDSARE